MISNSVPYQQSRRMELSHLERGGRHALDLRESCWHGLDLRESYGVYTLRQIYIRVKVCIGVLFF